MAKIRYRKHSRFAEPAARPYVAAIGQVALAWNDLHEEFAFLFITVMGGESHRKVLAVWNAIDFDRPKRKMLRAAVPQMAETVLLKRPQAIEDINWLLARTDSLEDARNDCIHSPLLATGQLARILAEISKVRLLPVVPHMATDNPRAKKLLNKDLLTEFRWCRDQAITLSIYAARINRVLAHDELPWPRRPALPDRGLKKIRRAAPRPPRPR